MKLKMLMVLIVVTVLSLFTGTIYAAGDLIVNGNLGVGTSTPSEKAEINGNMKVDQNLTVQGNLITNGSTSLGGNTSIQGNLVTNGSATVGGQLSVGTQGIKFSNGTIQTTVSGPTTQSDVTASRVLGTVYRNTTGKPLWVNVVTTIPNPYYVQLRTDASTAPTTVVSFFHNNTGGAAMGTVGGWVMPGNYYTLYALGGGTVNYWIEWY